MGGKNLAMPTTRRKRRRRPIGERRVRALRVLVTSEEGETLEAAAAKAGTTISTWLRAAGLAMARQGWPTYLESHEFRKPSLRRKRQDEE